MQDLAKLYHLPRRSGNKDHDDFAVCKYYTAQSSEPVNFGDKIMKIKKGDKVQVLLGKDRGKVGTVEYVMAKEKKVFVGGANLYKRHVKKMKDVQGGIIDIPKPLDVSNVALICPNCKKLTRVGYKTKGDIKSRICRKCKKELSNAKT